MVLGLMELPVEVVKRIVMEQPMASIVVMSSLGLLIARKPQVALKMFDRLVGSSGRRGRLRRRAGRMSPRSFKLQLLAAQVRLCSCRAVESRSVA